MHCAHRRPGRHVGARLAWRSRAQARGFTLIELIAVIVILGSLATVAVPTFLDLRTSAINVAHLSIATSFYGGVQNARAAWHVAPNGGSQVAALNHTFGGGEASFSASGWLVGRNNATATLSDQRCAEIWRIAMPNGPVTSVGQTASAGTPYNAWLHPLGFCAYTRLHPDGSEMRNVVTGTNIVYIAYDPFAAHWPTPGTVGVVDRLDVWNWFVGQ